MKNKIKLLKHRVYTLKFTIGVPADEDEIDYRVLYYNTNAVYNKEQLTKRVGLPCSNINLKRVPLSRRRNRFGIKKI